MVSRPIAIINKSSVEAQEHAARALAPRLDAREPGRLQRQSALSRSLGCFADGLKAPELAAVTIVRLAMGNLAVAQSIAEATVSFRRPIAYEWQPAA